MKNIRAKLFVLLLALFVTITGAQAQSIRLSHGFDVQRTFQDMDYNGYCNFNVAVTYEQILTNRFSIAIGARYGDRYIESFGLPEYSDWDSDYYKGIDFLRLSIPLEAEYKLPITNRVRLFVNGGVLFHFNHSFTSWMLEEGYYDYKKEQGEDYNWDASSKEICDFYGINRFSFGVGAGAGIEFGFLRLALQYDCDITNILKSSYNADYIDKYSNGKLNALTFNVGVRIGGNKLFRATSKSKTSTVNYPIEESSAPVSQRAESSKTVASSQQSSTATLTTTKVKVSETPKQIAQGSTESTTETAAASPAPSWLNGFGVTMGIGTSYNDRLRPNVGLTYDYFITRNISVGAAMMIKYVDSPLNDYYQNYGYYPYERSSFADVPTDKIMRFTTMINAEYKYLLTAKTRLYVNAALLSNKNIGINSTILNWNTRNTFNEQNTESGNWTIYEYEEKMKSHTFGWGVGAGIEFSNFRMGIMYDQDFNSLTQFDTDPYAHSLAFTVGYRFGGNKLFRKKSTVQSSSVNYPILEQ